MTTQVQTSEAETNSEVELFEEVVSNQLAECPTCGNRVILFSRTIQTYCYNCGLPVTVLDKMGLYYELVEATS